MVDEESARKIAEHLVKILGQRLHETGEPPTAVDVIERELNKLAQRKYAPMADICADNGMESPSICPKCRQWVYGDITTHVCLTLTRAELIAEILSLRRRLSENV